MHGATGIWYFAWDSFGIRGGLSGGAGIRPTLPLEYPEQSTPGPITTAIKGQGEDRSQGIKALNSELNALRNVILSPTSRENYGMFVSHTGIGTTSPIHTMLKSLPNYDHYLIAVNMDNSAVDAEFRFTRSLTFKTRLYGGSGQPGGTGGVMSDHFDPFDAKIYLVRFDCGQAVGGIAKLPDVARTSMTSDSTSDAHSDHWLEIGAGLILAVVALLGVACYGRRLSRRRGT